MFKIFVAFILSIALEASASELVVWNVGQGQWVSEIHQDHCLHYDMGGEINPRARALELCSRKMNYIHLSHWDWDHISFVKSFSSNVRKACLMPVSSRTQSSRKLKLIENLTVCSAAELKAIGKEESILFTSHSQKSSNEASEVIYSKDFSAVIPGDSPKTQEKLWAEDTPMRAQGLVLGHHGSRTSTSHELLAHLPHLKWAVASARQKRYGHPHREVVEALKKEKVPLLKTEDWGHLHFMKNEI